jgi:type I restriction enzyme M protein
LHGALKDILFDKDKRLKIFKRFLEIENNLDYDWFTNYFQEEQANRNNLKQDYTPHCLCDLVNRLIPQQSEVIYDECCGIGGLTISTLKEHRDSIFYLEELSDNSVMLLLFNLSIRGINAYVKHGDVLTNQFKQVYKLTNNGEFSDIEIVGDADNEFKADVVISNPPYSLKFDNVDNYKYDARFSNYGVPPKSKADYAFVLHGLSHLKENGSAFFILPHGVLFRGSKEGDIRKLLIDDNLLDAVIGLPSNLFLNTQIPVCVLIFKKTRNDKDILFIDASKEFVKEGKQNYLSDDQIEKIKSAYSLRKDIDKFSHVASLEEIKKNDYNLNIPRYVDTSEEKKPVDLAQVVSELVQIETEIEATEKEFVAMLKDLRGPQSYEIEKNRLISQLESSKKHSYTNMLNAANDFLEKYKEELKDNHVVNLLDIATIERSKKNKIYKKGSILIQLSATKGQMVYLDDDTKVDSKYGVFEADRNKIEPRYLYYVLKMSMPDFLTRYQTGLNIKPEIFDSFKIKVHSSLEVQKIIVKILDSFNVELEEKEIEKYKKIKEYHLDNMFPG